MTSPLRLCAQLLFVLAVSPSFADPKVPPAEPIATTVYMPDAVVWDSKATYRSVTLRVVGPGGFVHEESFGSGPAIFDLAASRAADGQYKYELVYGRHASAAAAQALAGIDRKLDAHAGMRPQFAAPSETLSGSFSVVGGKIVSRDLVEPRGSHKGTQGRKDVVTPDDTIIQGSLCVGFDCINNEVFGFSTIRLKENNTRIEFLDTSVGTFPSNEWTLLANDSASGGLNQFSLEDTTGAKTPFTVEAGAATAACTSTAPATSASGPRRRC